MKRIKLRNFEIGADKLTILAGPCAIENQDILNRTAEKLKEITEKLGINYIFKSSFDKANRSSITSFRGPGMEKGLEMLAKIKKDFDLPIVTDIHTPEQASTVAEVADMLHQRHQPRWACADGRYAFDAVAQRNGDARGRGDPHM